MLTERCLELIHLLNIQAGMIEVINSYGEDNGTNIYLVDKDSYLAKEGLLDGNNKKH